VTEPAPSSRLSSRDLIGAAVAALVVAVVAGRVVWCLRWMLSRPAQDTLWWAAIAAVGAVVCLAILRAARVGPATADAFVLGFHENRIDVDAAPVRFAGLLAGVGLGVPLGFEGPMLYFGPALGLAGTRRLGVRDRPVAVACAAASVGMVIGAPVAAAIFSAEVVARRRPRLVDLPPLGIGLLSSWAVLIATGERVDIIGVAPAVSVSTVVVAAALIGVAVGLGSRVVVSLLRHAKRRRLPFVVRATIAPMSLLAVSVISVALTDRSLFIGSGDRLRSWATQASTLAVLVALMVFVVMVATMLGCGMLGGIFIPLLTMGSLLGLVVAQWFTPSVPPVVSMGIGGVAMLGAAYGTPIAGVALGIALLGLGGPGGAVAIAVVVARLLAPERSLSLYQT